MSGCVTCGKQLSAVNRTGYCRQHYAAANNGGPRWVEDNIRRWADPEMRAKIMGPLQGYNRSRLAWCPLEYRGEYRRLTRIKHIAAPIARRMIEDMVAADLRSFQRTGRLPQQERMAA